MEIDPRLRGSTESLQAPYDQRDQIANLQESTHSSSYESIPPTATPSHSSQQHHYYGVQTPNSYATGAPAGSTVGSPYAQNSGPDSNHGDPTGDLKRPRACEACRQLKVRCELDETTEAGSCKRCAKAGRQCVITAPSRKRQKKTDSRVAELEKKIDALTASLHAQQGATASDPSIDPALSQPQVTELQPQKQPLYTQSPQSTGQWITPKPNQGPETRPPLPGNASAGTKRKMPDPPIFSYVQPNSQASVGSTSAPSATNTSTNSSLGFPSKTWPWGGRELYDNSYVDVVDRQVMTMDTARDIFNRYVIDMAPLFPAVVFDRGTTAEEVRKTRPILFLAILSVASGIVRPDLQLNLITEVSRIYADRIVCRGQKTLELVQSMVVTSGWYQPPDRYEELNFNQLIHIAAVMGIDMGMGKRTQNAGKGLWKEYMDKKKPMIDPDALETRRTWLGCYFLCANAAMSLRRQVLVRWAPYMDESIDILESSTEALPSDRLLCHLVRAQHIAEDVGFEFSMDDPTCIVSLADPKTQYHLKAFERHLNDWRQRGNGLSELQNPTVRFTEAVINLYMHEIVMHHDHNIDDFRPPYIDQTKPSHEGDSSPEPDGLTPTHVDALTICLQSIHRAFDAVLEMGVDGVRLNPTLVFVRSSYAAVVLIKLHSAVTGSGGGRFGAVFKKDELKVEYYLDRLITILKQAADGSQFCVTGKFAFILTMLKNWHLRRKESKTVRESQGSDQQDSNDRDTREAPQRPQHIEQQQRRVSQQHRNTTASGSNTHVSSLSSGNGGLHMLSEAATVNPRGPPPPHPMFHNNDAFAPMSAMGMPGTATGAGVVDPSYMSMAALAPDLDGLGFAQEEISALGSLMDDPRWLDMENMGMGGYDGMGGGYPGLQTGVGGGGVAGGWTGQGH